MGNNNLFHKFFLGKLCSHILRYDTRPLPYTTHKRNKQIDPMKLIGEEVGGVKETVSEGKRKYRLSFMEMTVKA